MIAYVQNTSPIPFQLSLLLPAASVFIVKAKTLSLSSEQAIKRVFREARKLWLRLVCRCRGASGSNLNEMTN